MKVGFIYLYLLNIACPFLKVLGDVVIIYDKQFHVFVDQVQAAGEDIGDMFEISTVRREDWDFIQVMISWI